MLTGGRYESMRNKKRGRICPAALLGALVLLLCALTTGCGKAPGNAASADKSGEAAPAEQAGGRPQETGTYGTEGLLSVSPELAAAAAGGLMEYAAELASGENAPGWAASAEKAPAAGDVMIPSLFILGADENDPEDVRLYGDFWCHWYTQDGETLVSGRGHQIADRMHFRRNEDGSLSFLGLDKAGGDSAPEQLKERFGARYDAFRHSLADGSAAEHTRARLIADYAAAYGLPVTQYRDYGWNPTGLPQASPEQDNIFLIWENMHRIPEEEPEELPPMPEIYVVRKGDTLWKISRRYDVPLRDLIEDNEDTIFSHAHRHGVRSGSLNRCADYIYPGEEIEVRRPQEAAPGGETKQETPK